MNLVIVEDSNLVRDQLVRRVSGQPRVKLVGTASGEAQAVDLILDRNPDAVLLDLSLLPGSGLRVLERIRQARRGARVLVLTNGYDEDMRKACFAMGISGFYDKTQEVDRCLGQLFSWLPPLPSNEAERVRALHALTLLDTPEDAAFDSVTYVARWIAETPIALITLVDTERQWFLSHPGLELLETSRSIGFCAHTIVENGFTEIPDARNDERFRDNPLVVGAPNIQFYAGVPLILSSGEAIGTLCVIDLRPRHLSEIQRNILGMMACTLAAEMENRKAAAAPERGRL